MKHLLKWIIPVAVLLIIGMWIGLNWNQFPANEEVDIPVVKKGAIKYDTAVHAVEAPATVAISQDDVLTSTEDSINAALAVMEEEVPEAIIPSPAIDTEAEENDESSPQTNVIAEAREKVTQQTKSTTARNTAQHRKQVVSKTVFAEQPRSNANKNVTPSPEYAARSGKAVISNNQEAVVKARAKKKEIVFDSYMSHKQIPVDHLVEVDGSYQPSATGKGVSAAKFLVYNRSGKNIKRVNLEVHYLSKGNQLLRKVEMPVSNISAEGAVSVEVPANTEADRLVYKVLYVSSALGDFYYEPIHIYANASR